MTKPIYSSAEHKTIIDSYMIMCQEFAKEVSSKNRYNNYLSVATNGFFAGLETSKNRGIIRAYKTVLTELVHDAVDKIDELKQTSE